MGNEARGLGRLKKVSEGIIIPSDDIFLYDRDEIDCRIIKFGRESNQTWKNDDGTTSTTEHLRIYLRIYQIRRDKNKLQPEKDAPKFGTINPQSRWLGEISKWSQNCEEAGDEDKIFRQRFTLTRKDRNRVGATGKYGYLEVTNVMDDPTWEEDDPEKISSKSEDSSAETQQNSNPSSNNTNKTHVHTSNNDDFDAELVKLFAVQTLDDLKAKAKELGEKYTDKREKVVTAFETKKYDIACIVVLASSNPIEKANEVASTWYAKNPNKAQQLQAYASTLKKQVPEEEDLPF